MRRADCLQLLQLLLAKRREALDEGWANIDEYPSFLGWLWPPTRRRWNRRQREITERIHALKLAYDIVKNEGTGR